MLVIIVVHTINKIKEVGTLQSGASLNHVEDYALRELGID